eukprot:jgi/Hompol1/6573/HPOL_002492-RA
MGSFRSGISKLARRSQRCCSTPPRKWSRRCWMRFAIGAVIGIAISLTTAMLIVLELQRHAAVSGFDGAAGPRGGVPGAPPGPPLPVLGVLSFDSPSGRPAVYFGASIDWTIDDPQHFNADLGHAAAIQDSFFYISDSALLTSATVNSSGILHPVSDIYAWTAALIRGTGAIMGVTVIPIVPLKAVSPSVLMSLAQKCKDINSIGVPVMLRFAPQMNGNWFPYGQDPEAYTTTFQTLAGLVKNSTNNTAMVWSPATALGYPFRGEGPYTPSNRSSRRFTLLDSNHDGKLDALDDPYLPFYPGDEFVDWVGLSTFYTTPNVSRMFYPIPTGVVGAMPTPGASPGPPWIPQYDNVELPSPPVLSADSPSFESQITSPGSAFDFYKLYAENRNKPLILSETGAAFYTSGHLQNANASEAVTKLRWTGEFLSIDTLQIKRD